MFVDRTKIFIKAGNGGDGCISFRREKFVEFGGPDGGNGGKGGDVYFVADRNYVTLYDFTRNRHFFAKDGARGEGKLKNGAGGEDLTIRIPCGSEVYLFNEETGEKTFKVDLVNDGDKFKIANGGRGGRGNATFKTQTRTAPRIAEKGEPGDDIAIVLELKLIANIGLLGYPNAGKSTFLASTTNAKPKIADYPFTTLTPNLGVVKYFDRQFVIADIPGIIEGAHEGKGLGFDFLRHVERTKLLLHLIDVNGQDKKNIYENFITMNQELFLYNPNLAKKKQVVLITKIDTFLDTRDTRNQLEKLKKKILASKKYNVLKIFEISAVTHDGIRKFLDYLRDLMDSEILNEADENEKKENITKFKLEPNFTVTRDENVFYVTGKKIETLVSMTYFNEPEALMRFQNILKKMGLDDELKKQGICEGDLVVISDFEFYFKN